jgi:hypothetical protein
VELYLHVHTNRLNHRTRNLVRLRASLHVVAKTKIPAPQGIQSRIRRSWLTQHRLSYAVHVTRNRCTVAYIGLYEVSEARAQVKTKRNAIGSHCRTLQSQRAAPAMRQARTVAFTSTCTKCGYLKTARINDRR